MQAETVSTKVDLDRNTSK